MQQRQANLNWHTSFFIQERMPYSGTLYTIKIRIAILVRDGELDEGEEVNLRHLIHTVAQSESEQAKEILQKMLDFALDCAVQNNFRDIIEKIQLYKEYLLPRDLIAAHCN